MLAFNPSMTVGWNWNFVCMRTERFYVKLCKIVSIFFFFLLETLCPPYVL